MKTKTLLILLLILLGCGNTGMPSIPNTMDTPMDGGPIYTLVPNPNSTLSFSGVSYSRDSSNKVSNVIGEPSINPGTIGQFWFVFPGPCPLDSKGIQDNTVVYPIFQKALVDGYTRTVASQPTATALGLYIGAQLPSSNCFEFANCYESICSFKPYNLKFN
jgi:hypothetical protein